ncbi:MAG: extracellular solute-binding protein [Atopostipes sp.]|nr:extracellular solute-binding protein [Atopostipes sp.]
MFSKKKLARGLALSSILLLTACGNDAEDTSDNNTSDEASGVEVAEEGFPIVDEKIELSIMAPGTGESDWEDMPTLNEYEEMTNIKLDPTTPPIDDFDTRFNLTIASGDYPDMIFGPGADTLTPALEVEYGEQGVLMPLNDLIDDYAPNLSALMEERPELRDAITTPDGNIYALPRVELSDTAQWPTGPLWYNGDWMEELDAEVPETLDEFYDLLVRFRDEDPNQTGEDDTIPFSNGGLEHPRVWLLSAFDIHEWGIEDRDGQAVYTPATDNAREYYKFMNKLFAEDLLDEEIFSQSDEMKKAKGEENRIGIFQDWFSQFTTGEEQVESIKNPMFMPLTSEFSEERSVGVSDGIGRGAFALSTENEHPEASMRWIDYLYSEEGYQFFDQGPEGYYWEWRDEDEGIKQLTEEAEDPEEGGENYRGKVVPTYGLESPGIVVELPPFNEDEDQSFSEFIKEETEEKITPYGEVAFPPVYLTEEEIEEVKNISGDLESYIEEEEAKFITGQLDPENDEDWNNYVSQVEDMDVERYEEIYQDALDRQ